jgi:hypothetical protein
MFVWFGALRRLRARAGDWPPNGLIETSEFTTTKDANIKDLLDLIALVRSIAMAWNNLTPELSMDVTENRDEQRASVIEGVRRLLST